MVKTKKVVQEVALTPDVEVKKTKKKEALKPMPPPVTEEKEPEPEIPPPVEVETKTKKPLSEKQIAAIEKRKANNAEKKKMLDDAIKAKELEIAAKEKELADRKAAQAEKRRLAKEAKKNMQPQLPEILSVEPPAKKQKKAPVEKAVVIENVIKQVVKGEVPVHNVQPAPQMPEQRTQFRSMAEQRTFENWMKKGHSIFGYSYAQRRERMR